MNDYTYALEEARKALLLAQERGADLERQLDHERTGRLQAEGRVAELEALIAKAQDDTDCLCLGCDASIYEGQCLTVLQNQPCPWGQAAASHRARVAEVTDVE